MPRAPHATACLACLCAVLGSAAAQGGSLSCDTQQELTRNLEYVRTVCSQAGETFAQDDPFDPVPLTCSKPVCARAVERVATDCGGLLGHGWFETWNRKLTAAVAKCALLPPPSHIYPIGATTTMTDCDGTLTDGGGKGGFNWNKHTVVDAGPGKVAQLTVNTLGLADDDSVEIFDGPAEGLHCPSDVSLRLARLTGHTLPQQRVYAATGRFLCVQLLTNKQGVGSGFTMTAGCVCEDSATWHDAIGRLCNQYARHATQSLFAACEGSAASPPAQGRGATGLVLPAEQACPRACEACGVDPCAQWPCHHGGACVASEPRECATASQFAQFTSDVNAACCDGAGQTCADGAPSACGATCARVLEPMWSACSAGVLQTPDFQPYRPVLQGAVALCHGSSGQGHRRRAQREAAGPSCLCAAGWSGAHCEVAAAPPPPALNDTNFRDAVAACLDEAPTDGNCTTSTFGPMASWDTSAVTDMSSSAYPLRAGCRLCGSKSQFQPMRAPPSFLLPAGAICTA